MKEIHVNVFNHINDNRVTPLDTTWENIVAPLTSPHEIFKDKLDSKLFNSVRYKTIDEVIDNGNYCGIDSYTGRIFVRRRKENIIESHLLVLDYDGGVTLDHTLDRFIHRKPEGYSEFYNARSTTPSNW